MKCHYEILGVERDCENGEIKKAYRKSALVWHPDKNQHRKDEAEEKFKEICNAYEVLSDPHERAWYDSHRDAILRSGERHQTGGGAEFAGGKRPDDEIDLFQFFSPSAFSGYNDGAKGFYTVYDALFSKLAEQENKAASSARTSQLPKFGLSTALHSEVSTFYAHWGSFATSKDFSWADQYNPASAPNRQVRRRMEEENKKFRKAARKEYNDTVRELVSYVKKRDKRLIAIQQAEAAKKAEREAAEAERRRREREERQRNASTYVEADWITASEGVAYDESEEEEEEEEEEEFYCVVCEKKFKNPKQLVNHEKSKKHQQKLAQLRAELEEEEELLAELGIDDGAKSNGGGREAQDETASGAEEGASGTDVDEDSADGEEEGAREAVGGEEESEEENDDEDADEDAILARMMGAHSSRQTKPVEESSEEEDGEESDEDEDAMLARMMGAHSSRQARHVEEGEEEEEEEEESDEDEDAMLARMMGVHSSRHVQGSSEEEEDGGEEQGVASCCDDRHGSQEPSVPGSFVGGQQDSPRKGEKAEEAACAAEPDEPACQSEEAASDGKPATREDTDVVHSTAAVRESEAPTAAHVPKAKKGKGKGKKGRSSKAAAEAQSTCDICSKTFDSRNHLFMHIKETGHAALKR